MNVDLMINGGTGMGLIIGASPGDDPQRQKFYQQLVGWCRLFFHTVCSPLDSAKFIGSNQERKQRAKNLVRKATLIIAECSWPSVGREWELAWAEDRRPVLCLHQADRPLNLFTQIACLEQPFWYDCPYADSADLKRRLRGWIGDFHRQQETSSDQFLARVMED